MNKDLGLFYGKNRTGTKISPIEALKTIEGAIKLTRPSKGDGSLISANRLRYIENAGPVGVVPLPHKNSKNVFSKQEKILADNLAIIDKLGERLAFERSAIRLYEGLLCKYDGTTQKNGLPERIKIEKFYHEEMKHYQMLHDVVSQIGADPTALTPAADILGFAINGWQQIINDPRTTFLQSLESILHLELVDNVGWELLIELAERNSLTNMAINFQQALNEETQHLITIKQWVQELTLDNEIINDKTEPTATYTKH